MDLLQTLIYTLARIGLFIMLVLLGAFVGEILFPSAVSFLPYSAISFKEFITDNTVQSVTAMVIVCLFFIWVFYDDGKRHAAYESWSMVNITIVMLIMLFVYFIPAIFRDSFHGEGKADVFYMVLYYPCSWAVDKLGGNYLSGIVAATLVMLAAAFAAYFISYRLYVKKHPSLLVPRAAEEIVDISEDVDDTDDL